MTWKGLQEGLLGLTMPSLETLHTINITEAKLDTWREVVIRHPVLPLPVSPIRPCLHVAFSQQRKYIILFPRRGIFVTEEVFSSLPVQSLPEGHHLCPVQMSFLPWQLDDVHGPVAYVLLQDAVIPLDMVSSHCKKDLSFLHGNIMPFFTGKTITAQLPMFFSSMLSSHLIWQAATARKHKACYIRSQRFFTPNRRLFTLGWYFLHLKIKAYNIRITLKAQLPMLFSRMLSFHFRW